MSLSPHAALVAAVALFPAAACSSGESAGTQTPQQQTPPTVVDTGPYAVENAALDRAQEMTGLPRDASLWIKRTYDSRVVCGALARPSGKPVMYLSGPVGSGYVGAPLARLTPEVGERMLDQWNEAVLVNCADHGLIPPEHVRHLLE